jgi:hypothetical protein
VDIRIIHSLGASVVAKTSWPIQLLKSEWLMASLNSLLLPRLTNLLEGVMLMAKPFFFA